MRVILLRLTVRSEALEPRCVASVPLQYNVDFAIGPDWGLRIVVTLLFPSH